MYFEWKETTPNIINFHSRYILCLIKSSSVKTIKNTQLNSVFQSTYYKAIEITHNTNILMNKNRKKYYSVLLSQTTWLIQYFIFTLVEKYVFGLFTKPHTTIDYKKFPNRKNCSNNSDVLPLAFLIFSASYRPLLSF